MTCFLTPDGRPFFCGTYYPKAEASCQLLAARHRRRGAPGAARWSEASDRIAGELRSMASGLPGGGPPVQPALCDHAVAAALRDEDVERGGFGGAPKFPPSALLEALLRNHERTGDILPLEAVERTLHGDGARRHLRPAGRRVRPLQRRRVVGGAALREDALRQRAAASGVRALGPSHFKPVGLQGGRRDRAVHDRRAGRRRACSPRRWTPTPTAARG